MSSGSFVIESWSKGTEVSYVKNENYLHADEIYLDGINVRVIADESTRLELFEKGELDFLTLGTTGQAQYGDDPRVYFYEAFAVQEIEFNFENPDKRFLSNVNFRKALFYATDRETLAAISGNAPANYFLGRRLVAYADGTSIGNCARKRATWETITATIRIWRSSILKKHSRRPGMTSSPLS